jgi:Tfp pilus assembly protein PilX
MTRHFARHEPAITAASQRGIVLIFSLIILLVLTLLGVGSMRTAALEQMMAGNTQELMRAFQAADSGLDKGMNTIKTSTPVDPTNFAATTWDYANMHAEVDVTQPALIQIGPAVRSSKPTGYGTANRAYYDQVVTGKTDAFARVTLHQGMTTGAPSNPFIP